MIDSSPAEPVTDLVGTRVGLCWPSTNRRWAVVGRPPLARSRAARLGGRGMAIRRVRCDRLIRARQAVRYRAFSSGFWPSSERFQGPPWPWPWRSSPSRSKARRTTV